MIADPMSNPGTRQHRGPLIALLVTLRPKQWTKNLLLFAGFLFTIDSYRPMVQFERACLGFVAFCLLSSSVYVINDLCDRENDQQHPRKRFRPIPSGELSTPLAVGAAIMLLSAVAALSLYLNPMFAAVAGLYFIVTLSYTYLFKHVVILDVLVLALGFVLRAIAGAVVIPVSISAWLILCTLMLALFLGLSKRRAELLTIQQSGTLTTRKILDEYTAELLDQMIVIVTSACVMSYSLYTLQSTTGTRHHDLMITIPFVIYGIFRYLYLMHRRCLGESPDSVIIEDRPTLINIALWALTTALIVSHTLEHYLPKFIQ